jgi:membrane associated rhomboid family serine protease
LAFQIVLLLIFVLDLVVGGGWPRPVDVALGFSTDRVSDGELYRLLTANLIHTSPGIFETIGLQHLLLNSLLLWVVGPTLSRQIGSMAWCVVAATAGVAAFGIVWIVGTAKEYFGGSSGVIWGVMATSLVLVLLTRNVARIGRIPFTLLALACAYVVALNMVQIFTGGLQERHIVHLAAGIAGLAIGFSIAFLRPHSLRMRD